MKWFVRISYAIAIFWTWLCAILAMSIAPLSRPLGTKVLRLWGRGWCFLTALKVTLVGIENIPKNRAVILAPNHQSLLDILVIATVPVDFYWVSKAELARIPFLGWAMVCLGHFFLKRNDAEHDKRVIEAIERALKMGRSIAIFPEGTRSRTGDLLPLKKGAFRLAEATGAPLIPIAILGTREIIEPGELPSRWGKPVTIRIGKPVYVARQQSLSEAIEVFTLELKTLLKQGRTPASMV